MNRKPAYIVSYIPCSVSTLQEAHIQHSLFCPKLEHQMAVKREEEMSMNKYTSGSAYQYNCHILLGTRELEANHD